MNRVRWTCLLKYKTYYFISGTNTFTSSLFPKSVKYHNIIHMLSKNENVDHMILFSFYGMGTRCRKERILYSSEKVDKFTGPLCMMGSHNLVCLLQHISFVSPPETAPHNVLSYWLSHNKCHSKLMGLRVISVYEYVVELWLRPSQNIDHIVKLDQLHHIWMMWLHVLIPILPLSFWKEVWEGAIDHKM